MARVRKQANEQLSDQNLERVIALLEAEKPITKKDACAMLHIAYNTTRLTKIIDEYKANIKQRAEMRKRFRNKPLEKGDLKLIVSSYLAGDSLADISDNIFRSVALVKRTLIRLHIPLRDSSIDYWHPVEVPLEAMQDDYVKDDLVFSARYNQPACIMKKLKEEIYRIWLYKDQQFAIQPFYELSDLRHVQHDLDVSIEDMPADEIKHLIYTALSNAKKAKK